MILHIEQQVAVHREGPVVGGGEGLQLVGGLPGLLDAAASSLSQAAISASVRAEISLAVVVSYWRETPMASL